MWPTRWPINTMSNLTDIDVRNAKEGEHTDGDGLILVVRASRSGGKLRRSWVLRIVDGGRRRKLGLGVYPSISLAQARLKAQDFRRKLAEGDDPSVAETRRVTLREFCALANPQRRDRRLSRQSGAHVQERQVNHDPRSRLARPFRTAALARCRLDHGRRCRRYPANAQAANGG